MRSAAIFLLSFIFLLGVAPDSLAAAQACTSTERYQLMDLLNRADVSIPPCRKPKNDRDECCNDELLRDQGQLDASAYSKEMNWPYY